MRVKRGVFDGAYGRLSRVILPLAVFLGAAGILQAVVRLLHLPAYLLPAPTDVLAAMDKYGRELWSSFWTTTQAALLGFAFSAVLGMLIALGLSTSSIVRRAFYPYTVFFQTVPIVAIAPLLEIWLEPGMISVVVSAIIVSVFPVIANTLTGLQSTDPALVDLFRLYGASPWARLWKLRLPAALPHIFTGFRVAAGLAVIGAVVSEVLVGTFGSDEGLGVRILAAKKYGKIDELFAAVLMTSLLGLLLVATINLAATFMLRNWHASEKEE